MVHYPLSTHFSHLLEEIKPPPERLAQAVELPPVVRDYLAQHEEFATKSPHSRLAGSYAQHLSVGDVKDVDFLVRVDGDPEDNDPPARDVLRGLKQALDGLPTALGSPGHAEFDITRNRRSVHVEFVDEGFHLDVVPCIAPDGFDRPIYVPDWGYETWIASHPLGVVALIEELEKEHLGKFRNLTKLLKQFRNTHMIYRRPKSYWLVAMAIDAVRGDYIDTAQPLAVAFDQLLNRLYARFLPALNRGGESVPIIFDPMLGHNVAWNWARDDFEAFMDRLEKGKGWSGRALAAEDKDEAIRLWRKVFGEAFPEEVDDYARALAASRQPGAAVVSSTGLILPGAAARRATTPVPATRYYGRATR